MSRQITTIRFSRLGRHAGPESLEPSCGIMDLMERNGRIRFRIMVDCGMTPSKTGGGIPDIDLLRDGKKIDAVCITHVHGDHVGYLPAISRFLSRDARVYMTRMSAAMVKHVFRDSLRIQARRRAEDRTFSERDVQIVQSRTVVIERPMRVEIVPGITALAWPAGHIPGACSYTFQVGRHNVHYSGDRCEHGQPGIAAAPELPRSACENMIIAGADCTYGAERASDERDFGHEMARGADSVIAALDKGGIAIVCAFSIHRAAAVAAGLQQYGVHKKGQLLMDGSARLFANVISTPANYWSNAESAPNMGHVIHVTDHNNRVDLAYDGKPKVVICTPGMGGPGGVATFWRELAIPDARSVMMFTGYLAPDTDGKQLFDAAKARKEGKGTQHVTYMVEPAKDGPPFEQTMPVHCDVVQIRTGAHQSRKETIDWYHRHDPLLAVVNHGSPAALQSLTEELSSVLDCEVYAADTDHTFEVDL